MVTLTEIAFIAGTAAGAYITATNVVALVNDVQKGDSRAALLDGASAIYNGVGTFIVYQAYKTLIKPGEKRTRRLFSRHDEH